jgi:glycosyltransferase involved in cell wall biosynthesis
VDWSEICIVVIPCFNEEKTIASLAQGVRQHLSAVMVVDDGSQDNTAALASSTGANVVRHSRNLGKGAALKTGLATALRQGFEWAFTMDGDGQHKPDDIPAFIRSAEQTGATLLVGNRMHNAQAIPWLRRVVNRWMSRRISERAGRFLPDSQCGFRLVNLKAWAALRLETDHFEIESEMLLAFVQAGYRVEFVPIQVIPKGRRSHIRPVRDTLQWLRWWCRADGG